MTKIEAINLTSILSSSVISSLIKITLPKESLSTKIGTKKEGAISNNDLVTTNQENTLKVVQDFTRRAIYSQFRDSNKLNKYADIAKNITSAKYMILNVTGGIANIGTGFANIMGEFFAEDSFDKKTLKDAVGMYISNSLAMITDLYKDHSTNFAVALTKFFKVVDLDLSEEGNE